jgi:iron complex outermembrane receptor protein
MEAPMKTLIRTVVHAVPTAGLFAVALVQASTAWAQTSAGSETSASNQAPAADTLEEVVVTGTNIRGVTPVGANVISVSSEELNLTGAQVLGDMLRDAPRADELRQRDAGRPELAEHP